MPYQTINALTLLIVIIGGINWALVGLFDLDLVTTIFHNWENLTTRSIVARIVYVLIGLSAVWQAAVFFRRMTVPADK